MPRSVPHQILAASLCATLFLYGCGTSSVTAPTTTGGGSVTSAQVIKHVVVIFDENESFDHYFGTYPNAANPVGETVPFAASSTAPEVTFTAAAGTPIPNNYISNPTLLTANPNCYTGGAVVSGGCNNTNATTGNGTGATNPFRMPPSQAVTSTETHSYAPEEIAFDNGAMDLFPLGTGAPDNANYGPSLPAESTKGLTMSYFDGNTVTALWNYAQNYSLNDRFFGAQFGPSTIGAINLISGQTNGVVNMTTAASGDVISDGSGGYTLYQDLNPLGDTCSTAGPYANNTEAQMSGPNIGMLLNASNVTWGWFQGGFNLMATNPAIGTNPATTGCNRTSATITSLKLNSQGDYVPRHNPFAFYPATSNPSHARPTAAIGATDAANHNYDVTDFFTALSAGSMPAVSFLKPPAIQDSHADNSDPLDEQYWLATTINAIQQSPLWSSTAIIIAYDDSDGWYDHMYDVVNGSNTTLDQSICNAATGTAAPNAALPGVVATTLHAQGRCGHGPRLPLLVISPWANKNYIDSTPTDQTSIIRFIEDTFLNGQRLGGGSYDAGAGSIVNMFNFSKSTPQNSSVVLICPYSGAVTSSLSSCGY